MAHRENKRLRFGEKEELKFSDERNENDIDDDEELKEYNKKKEGEAIAIEIDSEDEEEVGFFDERTDYEFSQLSGPYFSTYNCPEYQQTLKKWNLVSNFNGEEYTQKQQKYLKEHNESEGFDIQHFAPAAGCVLPVSRADKIMFNHCIDGVKTVLDNLKKRGDQLNLKFLRLIKANCNADFFYFVTFEAKNENSGEIKVYQSVIYHDHPYISSDTPRQTAVYMLRVKQGKVVLPVEDLRNDYESRKAKTIDIKGFHIVNKPELIEDCEIALKEVLEYLSSKGEEDLKLVKITTAKYEEQHDDDFDETNYMFLITFEAKKKDSEPETYQSVISLDVRAPTRLHMFGKEK